MSWIPKSDEAQAQERFILANMTARNPVILWGPPGGGKTQTVRALAERIGYRIEIIIGARKEPTFLEGVPIVERVTEARRAEIMANENITAEMKETLLRPQTINALPDWFMNCLLYPKTVVFWDEIGSMPEDVQAGALSAIEEREIDGIKLPSETIFIAAGNSIDHAANGSYLAAPLANRFAHYEFKLPDTDWIDGLRQNFGQPWESVTDSMTPEEVAAENSLGERRRKEFALLGAFLNTNSALIYGGVPDDPEKSSRAWNSRRSWTKLGEALAHAEEDDRLVRDMLMESWVGTDSAAAFKTWDARLNLPDIETLLDMTDTYKWEEVEADKMFAIFAYAVNHANKENFERVVNLMVTASKNHQIVGYSMSLDLAARIKGIFEGRENIPFDLLGKLSKAFSETKERGGVATTGLKKSN